MSQTEQQAADMRAPSGSVAPTASQELSAAGTNEAHNTTALTVGEMATLINAGVEIRVAFASAAGLAAQVGNTNLIIGPYGRLDWMVENSDKHVYTESKDGAATHEAYVWTSSGKRG